MRPFNMTDEEKAELLKQHKAATKEAHDRRVAEKGGLQPPEKK